MKILNVKNSFLFALGFLMYSNAKAYVPPWKTNPKLEDIRKQWFYDEENVLVKKIKVWSPDPKTPRYCFFLSHSTSSDYRLYILSSDYDTIHKQQSDEGFRYKNRNNQEFTKAIDYCDPQGKDDINTIIYPSSIAIRNNFGLTFSLDNNDDKYFCGVLWKKLECEWLNSSQNPIWMTNLKRSLDDSFFSGFGTEGAFSGFRNDLLYLLPHQRCTRPLAFVGGIFGSVAAFKFTIYNWILSRPMNYFFGDYILSFQVWQKIRKMIVTPKFKDITYGKKLDEMLEETAKKMKAMEPIQGKGLILHGKPGNGKTLLFEQLAYHANAVFFKIDALKVLVPVSDKDKNFSVEKTLAAIFNVAKFYRKYHQKPVIIFWDELDAFFKKRKDINDPFLVSVVNALLVQLNDMDPKAGIYFCGATNNLHSMDAALMRSGRAGRILELKHPLIDEIEALVIKFAAINKLMPKLSKDVVNYISSTSLGLSRADITDVLERLFEDIDESWTGKTLTPGQEVIFKEMILKRINNCKDSIESQKEDQ